MNKIIATTATAFLAVGIALVGATAAQAAGGFAVHDQECGYENDYVEAWDGFVATSSGVNWVVNDTTQAPWAHVAGGTFDTTACPLPAPNVPPVVEPAPAPVEQAPVAAPVEQAPATTSSAASRSGSTSSTTASAPTTEAGTAAAPSTEVKTTPTPKPSSTTKPKTTDEEDSEDKTVEAEAASDTEPSIPAGQLGGLIGIAVLAAVGGTIGATKLIKR